MLKVNLNQTNFILFLFFFHLSIFDIILLKRLKKLKVLNDIYKILTFLGVIFLFYFTTPVATKSITSLPKESSMLVESLQKQGYRDVIWLDRYILAIMGGARSGEIEIKHRVMNKIDFLAKISKSVSVETYKVTLIPGETMEVFFDKLSLKYGFKRDKLQLAYEQQAYMSDGAIVPDTYFVGDSVSEEKMVANLLSSSRKVHEKLANKYGLSVDGEEWKRYLIIASIVQKEAASNDEMPMVASVIYNRLAQDMRLQMDGTLNYGKYSHIKVTPQRIKEDKSEFNTYKKKGLPPYPICAVSHQAIESAINPEVTNYLYFMKNKNGTHDFTESYENHLGNINKAKE